MSALDALVQTIESYWSTKSTSSSREYSKKALKLIKASLHDLYHNPSNETREKLALGSHYAGKAINIAKTTAAHALSYTLTEKYKIPHGHAVSLTLPSIW